MTNAKSLKTIHSQNTRPNNNSIYSQSPMFYVAYIVSKCISLATKCGYPSPSFIFNFIQMQKCRCTFSTETAPEVFDLLPW